jgi:hypothetical protein
VERIFAGLLSIDQAVHNSVAVELTSMRDERRELLLELLRDRVLTATDAVRRELAIRLPELVRADNGSLEAIVLRLGEDVFEQLMTWRSRENPPNPTLAIECATNLVKAATADAGAAFAYSLMRLRSTQELLSSDEAPRALAAVGLARSVEWLESQDDIFGDHNPWDAASQVWACQELAVLSNEAKKESVYPWLQSYLRAYISMMPHRVCEVIALGLSWSGATIMRPVAKDPSVAPGRVLESAERWVGKLEAATALNALTDAERLNLVRWPAVLQVFEQEYVGVAAASTERETSPNAIAPDITEATAEGGSPTGAVAPDRSS